jgi:agmatine/peptidylarginine deiminase
MDRNLLLLLMLCQHLSCTCEQYECSSRNVDILESTTDAKGRTLEVIKVPCPPPMFRTHHEADTVDVSREGQLAVKRSLPCLQ